MTGLSVVICCHNSEARLPETLRHLARQQLIDFPFEVIVVDNGSTDQTASISAELGRQFFDQEILKVVSEPNTGLSNARRAGVMAAQYDLVLFCDDDNWLAPEYLHTAFNVMDQFPQVGVCGGKGEPPAGFEAPDWFGTYQHTWAVGPQNMAAGNLPPGNNLYGAGMIIRKPFLRFLYDHGFVSLLTDRVGTDLVSGGDNEICWWYRHIGYQLRYEPRLTFVHAIPHNRVNAGYLIERSAAKGRTEAMLQLYHEYAAGKKSAWVDSRWIGLYLVARRILVLFLEILLRHESLESQMRRAHLKASISFRYSKQEALRTMKARIIQMDKISKMFVAAHLEFSQV